MAIDNGIFEQLPATSYTDVLPQLENGDLLLCSGNSTMSHIIKNATDGIFSHVAIVLHLSESSQWLVVESVETIGVRCVTLKEGYLTNYNRSGSPYPGKVLIARHSAMQHRQHALSDMYHRAFALQGAAYDNQDILAISSRILLNKIGIDAEGKLLPDNQYICSEFVYVCYQAVNILLSFNASGFIAPQDVAEQADVTPVAVINT